MPADPFERVAGLTRGGRGWVPDRASVADRSSGRTPETRRAVPARVIVSAVACGVLVVILLLGRGALSEAGAVETVPARQTAGATALGSSGRSPSTSAGTGGSSSLPGALAGVASDAPTGQPGPVVVVHVAGKVRRPGLVTLPASGRLADAIQAAGGAAPGAAPQRLNLARHLVDGEKVVVPGPHDPVSDVPGTADVAGSPGGAAVLGLGGAGGAGPVDLNSATQAQLEELPGIGPVTASAIIGWRTAHQRFTRVEELGEVDGIGPKTLERLRPLVRV